MILYWHWANQKEIQRLPGKVYIIQISSLASHFQLEKKQGQEYKQLLEESTLASDPGSLPARINAYLKEWIFFRKS